jgi:ubiquinone/menaquinone biosynthesis C-methylase UbiE
MQEAVSPKLTERQRNEKEHYDALYGSHPRTTEGHLVFPPYEEMCEAVSGKEIRPYNQDWEFLREVKELNLAGQDLLELGCGTGEYTVVYAHLGARVLAVDLSAVAIEVARERARFYGLEDRITFICASAEDAPCPDQAFDAVVGTYILHHLEIEAAARRIKRMLKPGGVALFLEWVTWPPFDGIRALPMVRRFFPAGEGDVTDYERKLDDNDMSTFRRYFRSVTSRRFYNIARLTYFIPSMFVTWIKLDYWLQRVFPPLRRMGGAAIVRLDT